MSNSQSPFGPIALTFSGGGYRAAAFHLGTLSYLHKINLLKDIEVLSTVSGGTIVGAAYVLSLGDDNEAFETFFKDLYQKLGSTNLVAAAIKKMGKSVAHGKANYSDLIMALAETYDEQIFQGALFGELWKGQANNLKEIVFNATEFKSGTSFRFLKSNIRDVYIGSSKHRVKLETAKHIRIADIVAASSCFPGLFEPISFPDSFKWPNQEIFEQAKKEISEPVPLMDGGIYDNQGIESAVYAVESEQIAQKDPDYPGLIIVSDTEQPNDNIYTPSPQGKFRRFLSLRNMRRILFGVGIISAISCVFQVAEFVRKILNHEMEMVSDLIGLIGNLFLSLFPMILTALIPIGLIWTDRKIRFVKKLIQDKIPQLSANDWNDFDRLSINQLIHLFYVRIDSVMAMTSEIFLRQVRRLMYKDLYEDQLFKNKRISNQIFEIYTEEHLEEWLYPSEELKQCAVLATNMPTTLWFNEQSELDDLIITGQATMCHNILERIMLNYGDEIDDYPEGVLALYQEARVDWEKFKDTPDWLLKNVLISV